MKAVRFIVFVLTCQLLFLKDTYAESPVFNNTDRANLVSNLKNWHELFSIVRIYTTKSDLDLVVERFKKYGISLESRIGITLRDNVLYLANDPINLAKNGFNYKGHVFKYDLAKSYYENFQSIYKRIAGTSDISLMSLIINGAQARDVENSNAAAAIGIAAAALTGIAFCFEVPAWIVPVGVAITFIFTAVSIAYEIDFDSGLRSFECLPDGWSVTTKDTTVIKTIKNSTGKIVVEKLNRNGDRKVTPATTSQAKLFYLNQKACEAKNSNIVSEMNTAILTSTSSPRPGAVGAPTSK